MEKYDYREALTKDIKDWILTNGILRQAQQENWSYDEFYDWLYDELWNQDSVTGNGAYYYDSEEKCAEYLCHNIDLIYEMAREFGLYETADTLIKQYENKSLNRYFDCSVRCYLLGECIGNALEELEFDK